MKFLIAPRLLPLMADGSDDAQGSYDLHCGKA